MRCCGSQECVKIACVCAADLLLTSSPPTRRLASKLAAARPFHAVDALHDAARWLWWNEVRLVVFDTTSPGLPRVLPPPAGERLRLAGSVRSTPSHRRRGHASQEVREHSQLVRPGHPMSALTD